MKRKPTKKQYKVSTFRYKLPKVPSKKEVKKLFETCKDGEVMMMIFISTFHGLRFSEMLNLKWDDVDLENGELTVKDGKNVNKQKVGYGKDRIVPINEMFLDVWKAWKRFTNGQQYVIDDRPENKRPPIRWFKRGYHQKFRQLYIDCEMSDIESFQVNGEPKYIYNVHTFRHLCGVNLRRAGVSLEDIRDYLGHENVETTKIYIELCKDDLRESTHIGYAYPKSRLGLPQKQEIMVSQGQSIEELRLKNEILEKQLKIAELTAKTRLMEVSPYVYRAK